MTKGFHSIFGIVFYAAIILLVVFLFLSIVPIILILALMVWIGFKCSKIIKSWKIKKGSGVSSMDDIEMNNYSKTSDFSNDQVIDVEYKDVE